MKLTDKQLEKISSNFNIFLQKQLESLGEEISTRIYDEGIKNLPEIIKTLATNQQLSTKTNHFLSQATKNKDIILYLHDAFVSYLDYLFNKSYQQLEDQLTNPKNEKVLQRRIIYRYLNNQLKNFRQDFFTYLSQNQSNDKSSN